MIKYVGKKLYYSLISIYFCVCTKQNFPNVFHYFYFVIYNLPQPYDTEDEEVKLSI